MEWDEARHAFTVLQASTTPAPAYPTNTALLTLQVEGLRLAEAAASSPTAQLSAGTPPLSLRSAPQALALLARTHGCRCLYAGLSINYMKVS